MLCSAAIDATSFGNRAWRYDNETSAGSIRPRIIFGTPEGMAFFAEANSASYEGGEYGATAASNGSWLRISAGSMENKTPSRTPPTFNEAHGRTLREMNSI